MLSVVLHRYGNAHARNPIPKAQHFSSARNGLKPFYINQNGRRKYLHKIKYIPKSAAFARDWCKVNEKNISVFRATANKLFGGKRLTSRAAVEGNKLWNLYNF